MQYQHTETNLPIESEYPKLIRDKIPEIISSQGKNAIITTLDEQEYEQYLRKKLLEEAAELANADTNEHVGEETADLLEVAEALLKLRGFMGLQDIQSIRQQKNKTRGAFNKRLLMHGFQQ